MDDDRDASGNLIDDGFYDQLALLMIHQEAFTGAAGQIQAVGAAGNKELGHFAGALDVYIFVLIEQSDHRRDNAGHLGHAEFCHDWIAPFVVRMDRDYLYYIGKVLKRPVFMDEKTDGLQ
jgi:hypothetical protein